MLPLSLHLGGLWEAAVKSMKRHLISRKWNDYATPLFEKKGRNHARRHDTDPKRILRAASSLIVFVFTSKRVGKTQSRILSRSYQYLRGNELLLVTKWTPNTQRPADSPRNPQTNHFNKIDIVLEENEDHQCFQPRQSETIQLLSNLQI